MQELGVWSTAEGTTAARLQLESEEEWPAWASGALKGAAAGAATGAAAGPYGAIIGAVAGAGLGAAAGAAAPAPGAGSSPAPSAPPAKGGAAPAAQPAGDANRARAVQALQQFAAAVPILVQLVAAGGGSGKESAPGENGQGRESLEGSEWGPESFQGTWTTP